jgi:hypothetical protein
MGGIGRSTNGLSPLQPIVNLPAAQASRQERAADQANHAHGIP